MSDYIKIVRKGGGKGGQQGSTSSYVPSEAPNTLRSTSSVSIIEVISEGIIKGFHTGDPRSVYLDKTPILNSDGSANFNVPNISWRWGTPDQDPVPGFSDQENEINVGVEITPIAPIIRTITPGTNEVRYKVRFNALYSQTAQGDVIGTGVNYRFSVRTGGGAWSTLVQEGISGKTMSPYERAVRVQMPDTTAEIDIMMERLDPMPGTGPPKIVNNIFFSSYTEIVDVNLKYNDTAYVAMVVDSQYFPTVPQRAYLIDGIICDIPNNYDPYARTYSGDWDGTFTQNWTNNPAWVLYNLLTNERYGIGKDITAANVDKWSFYEASQYNDNWLPDGYGGGGYEPRFTFNYVLNTLQDAFTVLTNVASSMRALLYYSNGTLFLVQDKEQPGTSDRIFSAADVENGLFDYMGTDVRSMYNSYPITWNNPDQFYQEETELVNDSSLIAVQGYRNAQPQAAFGCTSRGQAIRFGRWLIYTSQYETEVVTFRVGIENADLRPGQKIAISDPGRVGSRLGGRLKTDDSADTLTFDSDMPQLSSDWKINVTVGGKTVHQCTVVYPTALNQVKVTGKPSGLVAGDMWLAQSPDIVPTEWRVVVVKDLGQSKFEVMASQYSSGKYPYVDYGVRIPPPRFTQLPTGPLAGPGDMRTQPFVYADGQGLPQFGLMVSWQTSTDPRVAFYQVELHGPGDEFMRYERLVGMNVDARSLREGIWNVTLMAVDNLGRRSIPINRDVNVTAASPPPDTPTNFLAVRTGDTAQLTWDPNTNPLLDHWIIKWSPVGDGSATWEGSTILSAKVASMMTSYYTPYRPGTYSIKGVDTSNQQSIDAAFAILFDSGSNLNLLYTITDSPTWTGDLGGAWVVNSPEIWLPPGTVAPFTAIYTFVDANITGTIKQGEFVTGLINAGGHIGTEPMMSDWVTLASVSSLDPTYSGNWDAHLEVSISQDGTTWSNWVPITSASITARDIKARLVGTVTDLLTTIKVVSATVQIRG